VTVTVTVTGSGSGSGGDMIATDSASAVGILGGYGEVVFESSGSLATLNNVSLTLDDSDTHHSGSYGRHRRKMRISCSIAI
jgi:hypothetical protein